MIHQPHSATLVHVWIYWHLAWIQKARGTKTESHIRQFPGRPWLVHMLQVGFARSKVKLGQDQSRGLTSIHGVWVCVVRNVFKFRLVAFCTGNICEIESSRLSNAEPHKTFFNHVFFSLVMSCLYFFLVELNFNIEYPHFGLAVIFAGSALVHYGF